MIRLLYGHIGRLRFSHASCSFSGAIKSESVSGLSKVGIIVYATAMAS